ncbi:MAG: DUF1249 domain-containing protein [Halieaceae bacterium]|nr:DUF1249 domain-containing protein [Halieaceae bacterium]
MRLANKKNFKLDLTELHAVCEGNYARLLRLFPDYETCNGRVFDVGTARVRMEVTERCRYTTIFKLYQQRGDDNWMGQIQMEVRAYHDASMVEVVTFQSHHQVHARYPYPNDHMYQQDEKSQQNRFLADWLEHCLNGGRAATKLSLSATHS